MTDYFVGQGSPLIEAQRQTIAWIGQQVQLQASFFAYMDAFSVLTLLALAAVPLALSLRNVKPGAARPPAIEADLPVSSAEGLQVSSLSYWTLLTGLPQSQSRSA
jgi:hypothetical protein